MFAKDSKCHEKKKFLINLIPVPVWDPPRRLRLLDGVPGADEGAQGLRPPLRLPPRPPQQHGHRHHPSQPRTIREGSF